MSAAGDGDCDGDFGGMAGWESLSDDEQRLN